MIFQGIAATYSNICVRKKFLQAPKNLQYVLTLRFKCDIISARRSKKIMPKIIPIEDLKNTSKISEMCKESDEPVFVTKNGYGDMVIMSAETYEKKFHLLDVYEKLDEADRQVKSNKASDAYEALSKLRKKIPFIKMS